MSVQQDPKRTERTMEGQQETPASVALQRGVNKDGGAAVCTRLGGDSHHGFGTLTHCLHLFDAAV